MQTLGGKHWTRFVLELTPVNRREGTASNSQETARNT